VRTGGHRFEIGFRTARLRNIVTGLNPGEDPGNRRTVRLVSELIVLFVALPGILFAGWIRIPVMVVLIVAAGGCWVALQSQGRIQPACLFRLNVPRREWIRVFRTLGIALPLMLGLLWWLKPHALFSLPIREPGLWVLVMVAYPLISVVPQELVYRVYFFDRYRPLFGSENAMRVASSAAFSLGHVVFHNWPAVLLTLCGGWLFSRTYQRTRLLLFVAIEHALYGAAVFTIGWGEYFLEGTLRLFR
jgi:hypothetical protein